MRAPPNATSPAPLVGGNRALENDHASELISPQNSKWRAKYKVHPAADVFPMMSDEELDKLGADIKANGINNPITFDKDGLLLDGRNRLEAAERASADVRSWEQGTYLGEPATYIISQNIHRRHLTKQQQADLIVAALKASRHLGEVPRRHVKGKAGSEKNETKVAAVAAGKAHGISQRTVERAFAKAVEGDVKQHMRERVAKAKPESESAWDRRTKREWTAKQKLKPTPLKPKLDQHTGLDAARRYYLECVEQVEDLDAEHAIVMDALREIAGKRANLMQTQVVDTKDDYPELPDFLDRRRKIAAE